MMTFLLKVLIIFFVFENQSLATSTSFEQNLIFNNNNQSLKMNANRSIGNFNALAIGGSISIIGEKLYQAGFFSPFGFIPDNIKNLSPIVFKSKTKSKISNINPICNNLYLNVKNLNSKYEDTFLFIEITKKCNLKIQDNNSESIDNLLKRYF
tara:strand:- start:806 stop:1264 length:459 start_codon:yes stop_codon:yes gene_type:complete